MGSKKITSIRTKKSKLLRKAKKLEATKPLAVSAFLKIDGMSGE